MTHDYIIAGAGLGGLSFMNHLLSSEIAFDSILIVDSDTKKINDRTWSFWSSSEPIYACAQGKSWNQLGFASDNYTKFENVSPYTYYTIRGLDFYEEIFKKIRADSRVKFVNEKITQIKSKNNSVKVTTRTAQYHTKYLIDSTSRPKLDRSKSVVLSQNFVGWRIETIKPSFDPECPILMDFRIGGADKPGFIYLLPYSEHTALVEYTEFSTQSDFDEQIYEDEIAGYISKYLGVSTFTIFEKEKGKIPMTDHRFVSRPHPRIFNIGTSAGDTKATTGYTFMNVQRHAIKIIHELNQTGVRTNITKDRFDFYDSLLLQIMYDKPQMVKKIMEFLFKSQSMPKVLKFLDEETSLKEELNIFRHLPWAPFLTMLLKKTSNAIFS